MSKKSTGFGEAQIAVEMLSAATRNYDEEVGRIGYGNNQVIYAIRVISYFVTFYRGEFSTEYMDELENGLPLKFSANIRRFPGLNTTTSGLDLIDAGQRNSVVYGLSNLRHALVSE